MASLPATRTSSRSPRSNASRAALEGVGSSLADVVRTRMFVVDIAANNEAIGRAHGEYFRAVRPVATMVGVAALIAPGFVVEIEVDALATA